MSHNKAPQARLAVIAEFPHKYFLESIAVRADNSMLITVATQSELWYVPPVRDPGPVEPTLLKKFDLPTLGLAEVEPDVFLMLASNIYTDHRSVAYKLDLREWHPGKEVSIEQFCDFPSEARGLNGCCLLAPGVLLVADCFASMVWRVDFEIGSTPTVRPWLRHDSMGYFPGRMKPEQPGVNGIRYAAKSGYVYYTSTAKKLLMRLRVDPLTHEAANEPELVVAGRMGDDFCIDEEAEVLYLATHRQNTIDVVSLDPGLNSGFTQSVAGEPFTEVLIGPTVGAWSRVPGDAGRIAFFLTDGGTASPAPMGLRTAKLLRVELQPVPKPFPGMTA